MRIKIGDGKLFFDVDGAMLVADGPRMRERPTLVLLHGGPGMDHSAFKPDLNPLTRVAQTRVSGLTQRRSQRQDVAEALDAG
jgi:hypothetical protein